VQLSLIHTKERPEDVNQIARRCQELFPHKDGRVNRELAILLTHFRREGQLDGPVHAELLDALLAGKEDRAQQIHYFYCLRLLHQGWTPKQRGDLLAWYDATKTWEGGHSFTPFLENILRDANPIFTAEDRRAVVAGGEQLSWAATALLRFAPRRQLPPPAELEELYLRLLRAKAPVARGDELKAALVEALGRSPSPEAQAALRKISDQDPDQRDAVASGLARNPVPENWPYLVRGLETSNPVVLFRVVEALKKVPTKPKPEDPAPYRALLKASSRLSAKDRWKVVELLRHWGNNKQFGADEGDWQTELASWFRWFGQTFPKEPALANAVAGPPTQSKYKFEELLDFLVKDPAGQKGDPARGRLAFEKAQCFKCHKFGQEGEGVGPDLTTVSKRFKRVDTLESIMYPSKVISDQYRSAVLLTTEGQQISGLAAPVGDVVTVVQSDGTKVTLKKDEVEQQFTSLTSVMPDKLLDTLTKQEIADLFAFLEAEPK
jgi:putative heme-binding domain-containing protein